MAEPIIINGKWGYHCPVCGGEFVTEYDPEEVVYATIDCLCGALLRIEEDLTCTNFYKSFHEDMNEYRIARGYDPISFEEENFGYVDLQ